mgnify:CR=1 FL=1
MGKFDQFEDELDDGQMDVEQMTIAERMERLRNEANKQFDPDHLPSTFMYVSVSGTISSGAFKEAGFVKMDYELVCGKEWDLVEGEKKKSSQAATMNYTLDDTVVWGVSFKALYRTLEIAGWPKLVMKFEGSGGGNTKLIKGYATCVFPVSPGAHRIKCFIFKPVTNQFLGHVYGDQVKEPGKGIDAQMIVSGKGRDGNIYLLSHNSREYGIRSC